MLKKPFPILAQMWWKTIEKKNVVCGRGKGEKGIVSILSFILFRF